MTLEGWFESYDFVIGNIFNLREEFLPAGKRACGARATSALVYLPVVSAVCQDSVSKGSLESWQREYDEYCRRKVVPMRSAKRLVPMMRVFKSCPSKSCSGLRL